MLLSVNPVEWISVVVFSRHQLLSEHLWWWAKDTVEANVQVCFQADEKKTYSLPRITDWESASWWQICQSWGWQAGQFDIQVTSVRHTSLKTPIFSIADCWLCLCRARVLRFKYRMEECQLLVHQEQQCVRIQRWWRRVAHGWLIRRALLESKFTMRCCGL